MRLRARPNWAKAVKAENGQEMRLGNLVSASEVQLGRLGGVNKTSPHAVLDSLVQGFLSSRYSATIESPKLLKMADVNSVRIPFGSLIHPHEQPRCRSANPCPPDSQSNGADALEETLSRLSKKPGVKATIALDRASGTILKTAGQLSSLRTSSSQQQQQDLQSSTAAASSLSASTSDMPASSGSAVAAGTSSETQGAEELASMVWAFVNTAGGLVHGLDTEVKLNPRGWRCAGS